MGPCCVGSTIQTRLQSRVPSRTWSFVACAEPLRRKGTPPSMSPGARRATPAFSATKPSTPSPSSMPRARRWRGGGGRVGFACDVGGVTCTRQARPRACGVHVHGCSRRAACHGWLHAWDACARACVRAVHVCMHAWLEFMACACMIAGLAYVHAEHAPPLAASTPCASRCGRTIQPPPGSGTLQGRRGVGGDWRWCAGLLRRQARLHGRASGGRPAWVCAAAASEPANNLPQCKHAHAHAHVNAHAHAIACGGAAEGTCAGPHACVPRPARSAPVAPARRRPHARARLVGGAGLLRHHLGARLGRTRLHVRDARLPLE